ncbi:hypothetical protein LZC95_20480 [Pendulispora brunnea]|uniref:Uncharacterized protein n=1 Tax=Pendulispora brunnea TaxID=2905690 RepID=A0ABZ2KND2_9BACT
MERAKKVQAGAAPAVVAAARAGRITVNDALRALHYPEERQVEAVARVEGGEVRTLKEAFCATDGGSFVHSGPPASNGAVAKTREHFPPQDHERDAVPVGPALARVPTRYLPSPPADDVREDRQLLEEIWKRANRLSRVAKIMLHRDLGRHLADLEASNTPTTSPRPLAGSRAPGGATPATLERTA